MVEPAVDGSALACRNVSPRYGSIVVARDVSLSVAPGEVVALLGPNGAGKTSTVECLAGRVAGDGEVEVAGQRLDALPAHRRARLGLALVPDDRGLFGDLSVLDNLRLGAELAGDGRGSVDEATELFPVLGDRIQQRASTLSGGEQQMLAVGRAIVSQPKALILDEPTQGLAPVIYETLIMAMQHLRAQGLAILLVEQNVAFAAAIADRYIVMSGGRLVDEGSSPQLAHAEDLFEKYMSH